MAPGPVRRARQTASDKRSSLPCPYISSDIQPYKSMITGEMITSRSEHRAHLKKHDCIEVGNEVPKIEDKHTKSRKRRAAIRKDMQRAVQDWHQGFRNAPVERADNFVIDRPVESGTVVRDEVKDGAKLILK